VKFSIEIFQHINLTHRIKGKGKFFTLNIYSPKFLTS